MSRKARKAAADKGYQQSGSARTNRKGKTKNIAKRREYRKAFQNVKVVEKPEVARKPIKMPVVILRRLEKQWRDWYLQMDPLNYTVCGEVVRFKPSNFEDTGFNRNTVKAIKSHFLKEGVPKAQLWYLDEMLDHVARSGAPVRFGTNYGWSRRNLVARKHSRPDEVIPNTIDNVRPATGHEDFLRTIPNGNRPGPFIMLADEDVIRSGLPLADRKGDYVYFLFDCKCSSHLVKIRKSNYFADILQKASERVARWIVSNYARHGLFDLYPCVVSWEGDDAIVTLLRSGDIESNPGPYKPACVFADYKLKLVEGTYDKFARCLNPLCGMKLVRLRNTDLKECKTCHKKIKRGKGCECDSKDEMCIVVSHLYAHPKCSPDLVLSSRDMKQILEDIQEEIDVANSEGRSAYEPAPPPASDDESPNPQEEFKDSSSGSDTDKSDKPKRCKPLKTKSKEKSEDQESVDGGTLPILDGHVIHSQDCRCFYRMGSDRNHEDREQQRALRSVCESRFEWLSTLRVFGLGGVRVRCSNEFPYTKFDVRPIGDRNVAMIDQPYRLMTYKAKTANVDLLCSVIYYVGWLQLFLGLLAFGGRSLGFAGATRDIVVNVLKIVASMHYIPSGVLTCLGLCLMFYWQIPKSLWYWPMVGIIYGASLLIWSLSLSPVDYAWDRVFPFLHLLWICFWLCTKYAVRRYRHKETVERIFVVCPALVTACLGEAMGRSASDAKANFFQYWRRYVPRVNMLDYRWCEVAEGTQMMFDAYIDSHPKCFRQPF